MTVQFYASVTVTPTVLPRFLRLLTGLAARPHEALAACGIGALSRLLLSAGHLFDAEAWQLAVGALAGVMKDTLPDVRVLVVGPGRGAEEQVTGPTGETTTTTTTTAGGDSRRGPPLSSTHGP